MIRHEAQFYKKWSGEIICQLCPHMCKLLDGEFGKCGVRKSIEDILITTNYGKVVAQNIDPIEKKPLYHFWPGSRVYSIASPGCNLSCKWCQNFEVSQNPDAKSHKIEPEKIVEAAVKSKCQGIAYTYTEPTVFFEYAYEVAKLAKKEGLFNVWISNGLINPKPLKKIGKFIDAANIDIKGNSLIYRHHADGLGVETVLKTVEYFHKKSWVEVTNLVIPGVNDTLKDLEWLVSYLADLDERIPLHLSAFHPDNKMKDKKPTGKKKISEFVEVSKEQLEYVYAGNVGEDANTHCIGCGINLIERKGYTITKVSVKGSRCSACEEKTPFIGKIIKPF
ncbi:MAG: AmmeMemoRadiSam system radical SAM enzyme [Candidatus Altiarchaeota archaeon]|nr:AmmeMemoRadiSam system radical SAM enzyme [Candidatus Altiarchaeota archaeon]